MVNDLVVVNSEQSKYIRKLIGDNITLSKENERLKKDITELQKILAVAIGSRTIVVRPNIFEDDCPRFILDENLGGDLLVKIEREYYHA